MTFDLESQKGLIEGNKMAFYLCDTNGVQHVLMSRRAQTPDNTRKTQRRIVVKIATALSQFCEIAFVITPGKKCQKNQIS